MSQRVAWCVKHGVARYPPGGPFFKGGGVILLEGPGGSVYGSFWRTHADVIYLHGTNGCRWAGGGSRKRVRTFCPSLMEDGCGWGLANGCRGGV